MRSSQTEKALDFDSKFFASKPGQERGPLTLRD